jgi:hypothetical protein
METIMTEIWKAIPGYEGLYEVSNLGRVRGLDRVTEHYRGKKLCRRVLKGQILKPGPASNGYPTVNLCTGTQARRRNYPVQHLVLLAFKGPPPPGMICLHKENNRTDVRLENLYYGTYKHNSADTVRDNNWNTEYYRKRHWDHREKYVESRKRLRKFTPEQVENIKDRLAEGESNNSIAKSYGVNHGAICAIRRGRTYQI